MHDMTCCKSQVFDFEGRLQRCVALPIDSSLEAIHPSSMAFDRAGRCVVCDEANDRVVVMSRNGYFITELKHPGLKPRRACVDLQGRILVVDAECDVHVFAFKTLDKASAYE